MPATYKDIQRMTGFSLSTISKFFNGSNVRPATKLAIEAAAAQLDFRVNDFARGLRSRKSMAVGLLVPRLNTTFAAIIMRRVGHFLRLRGYSSIICDSDADRATERDAVNFLIDKMVDGIISIPFDASGLQYEPARARGVPVVLMDRVTTDFEADAVVIDNYAAGGIAAQHLLSRGHTSAAIICGPSGVYTMDLRKKGFSDAFLQRDGAVVREAETFFSIDGGYTAAKQLLESRGGVTAMFCANYELTLGAISAMNELGVMYPAFVSLIGFDNLELTGILRPALTIIEQPIEQLARSAVNQLLKRLEADEGEYETIMLDATLAGGKSVADLS